MAESRTIAKGESNIWVVDKRRTLPPIIVNLKLASVLTPLSDYNLTLASQVGVDEIVIRCPGQDLSQINELQARVESYGMRVGVVEGGLPIEAIKLGRDDGTELDQMKTLVRHLGDVGIPLVCYNFMAGTDWIRNQHRRARARWCEGDVIRSDGGRERSHPRNAKPYRAELPGSGMSTEALWVNLEAFLTEIIPVAEEAGVTLAMHPDDPPVPALLGNDRHHARRRGIRAARQPGALVVQRYRILSGHFLRNGN